MPLSGSSLCPYGEFVPFANTRLERYTRTDYLNIRWGAKVTVPRQQDPNKDVRINFDAQCKQAANMRVEAKVSRSCPTWLSLVGAMSALTKDGINTLLISGVVCCTA